MLSMVSNITFPNLGLDFTVNRVAFSIGNMNIYWYGLIIAIGMILGLIYAMREFKRCDLNQDDLLNIFLICVPVSIIFARAYFVIFSFDQYRGDLLSIFNVRNGGIAVYGSLIGILLVLFVYCYKKKINLGSVLDILAVGFLIGQGVGRWGNFVNGEAFGSFTNLPWAMSIASGGVTYANSVHPTFLYESLWDVVGVVILCIYRKHKSFNGEIFCAYILWYGIGRFWIEGLRMDSLFVGSLRISQIVALISALLGTAVIVAGRTLKRKNISINIIFGSKSDSASIDTENIEQENSENNNNNLENNTQDK